MFVFLIKDVMSISRNSYNWSQSILNEIFSIAKKNGINRDKQWGLTALLWLRIKI